MNSTLSSAGQPCHTSASCRSAAVLGQHADGARGLPPCTRCQSRKSGSPRQPAARTASTFRRRSPSGSTSISSNCSIDFWLAPPCSGRRCAQCKPPPGGHRPCAGRHPDRKVEAFMPWSAQDKIDLRALGSAASGSLPSSMYKSWRHGESGRGSTGGRSQPTSRMNHDGRQLGGQADRSAATSPFFGVDARPIEHRRRRASAQRLHRRRLLGQSA